MQRAISIDPNNADNFSSLATAQHWAGNPLGAIESTKTAMRLNPRHPPHYYSSMGRAYYSLSKWKEAINVLEKSVKLDASQTMALAHLMAACGQINKKKKAKSLLVSLDKIRKSYGRTPFTINRARDISYYKRKEDLEKLLDGLRKAGVPE